MTVVLDSWAIVRFLEDRQPAAGLVADLLDAERPVVSWVNLGEVFYVVCRERTDKEAADTVRDLREVATAVLPSEADVITAARIKADFPLSYADAFAAATALAHDATLWTGDPELMPPGAPWAWRDLR